MNGYAPPNQARTTNGGAPLVGGPVQPQAPTQGADVAGAAGITPWRRAVVERSQIIGVETFTLGTSLQTAAIPTIQGSGYFQNLEFDVNVTVGTAGTGGGYTHAAGSEDSPFNLLQNIILGDVNAPTIYVTSGFNLYLANLYGGFFAAPLRVWPSGPGGSWVPANQVVGTSATAKKNLWAEALNGSADPNVFFLPPASGASSPGGTAGQSVIRFPLIAPLALNRRSGMGAGGNQDRAQHWDLNYSINTAASLDTLGATTTVPVLTATVRRLYNSYTVPEPYTAQGTPNEFIPPWFGIVNYILEARSEAQPAPGMVSHYFRRLGTTGRVWVLIFRSVDTGSDAGAGALRWQAEAAMPSAITFYAGDQPFRTWDVSAQRRLMAEVYGFDAPNGVLVFENIHDFDGHAGYELGEDYFWSQDLAQARFDIIYPAASKLTNHVPWAAGSSLTILFVDMSVPENLAPAIYSYL